MRRDVVAEEIKCFSHHLKIQHSFDVTWINFVSYLFGSSSFEDLLCYKENKLLGKSFYENPICSCNGLGWNV